MLRHLFFLLCVRPLVLLVLGLNVRRRVWLPRSGPAIVVANHNSHLDTLVLMALLPWRLLSRVRPVAAVDYFMSNPALRFFSTRILNIVPLDRTSMATAREGLQLCSQALAQGAVLILFPEGTRGEPEQLSQFKAGIALLAQENPQVPVTPVFLHGLGKALPRGDWLLVPFFCDVWVGEALFFEGDRRAFMDALEERFHALSQEAQPPAWE